MVHERLGDPRGRDGRPGGEAPRGDLKRAPGREGGEPPRARLRGGDVGPGRMLEDKHRGDLRDLMASVPMAEGQAGRAELKAWSHFPAGGQRPSAEGLAPPPEAPCFRHNFPSPDFGQGAALAAEAAVGRALKALERLAPLNS